MSVFQQLECLETKGFITDGQLNRIRSIAANLPTTQADLLAIIAAGSLVGQEDIALGEPISVQSITAADASDIQALTVPTGATKAVISVHGNNIIFRLDGGSPALLTGHFAEVGRNFTIGSLESFKFVSVSATDATIFVTYY